MQEPKEKATLLIENIRKIKTPFGFCSEFRVAWPLHKLSAPRYFYYTIITKVNTTFYLKWKLIFSLSEHEIKLHRIELHESKESMFGNFSITSESNCSSVNGIFDSASLPFEQKYDLFDLKYNVGKEMLFIIHIYQNDCASLPCRSVNCFSEFLENKKLADVTLTVQDEKISAHKVILSGNSQVFARMFDTNMLENQSSQVEITDVEPIIFKKLLSFIYGEKFDCEDTDQLLKIIVASDKYSINSLLEFCIDKMINKLCVLNAVDVLIIADLVNAKLLKKKCIDFIKENKNDVIGTVAWSNMVKSGSHSELLAELFCSS